MFQAFSTPDLALAGNSVAFYARTRSRPGTAMNVTTAEPVFERMSRQGSVTHLPSLNTSSRRSLFLPPRRTASSATIKSEPISRENRSSVLRQKRVARILDAQRASIWPQPKKKVAPKAPPTPTKALSPFRFHIPTNETLQRRFAEAAANSASVNRATLEDLSPKLNLRPSRNEVEFLDQQREDYDDQLEYSSTSTLFNSPSPHYDKNLIDELKLSLSRLEESVRRAQEPRYDFAQNGAVDAMLREDAGDDYHSRKELVHKPSRSSSITSPQQSKLLMNGNAKSQVPHKNGHHETLDDRLAKRNTSAVKIQWFYRRYRSRVNFVRRREASKTNSGNEEKLQSNRQQIESDDTNGPKTPHAQKSDRAPIESERTAALLEDFFNQNSRSSPPKDSIAQSDRSNASTDRNHVELTNQRIVDEDAFDHYKNNFGQVRQKSYDSNGDRSFIESEIRSRVPSVQGRIVNNEPDDEPDDEQKNNEKENDDLDRPIDANGELENNDLERPPIDANDPPSSRINASTPPNDWTNRRRVTSATLILRSSTRSVLQSPLPDADKSTRIDPSKSFDEYTHLIDYLKQQTNKDEERRSEISARSIISNKSDASTVKDSTRSRLSSAREVDSIVDEVIREKHVLIKLCTNLLQQVHDIGVQMNRYEHKTERRLQKLKYNGRGRESIALKDQDDDLIQQQMTELKSLHAAEIDQLKNAHQVALDSQRMMYENALTELEKELGEVRERLAAVQASIARIPHSGRQNNSGESAYVQTEVVEAEMIDGNEHAIDSNKQSIDVADEDKNWAALTAEESGILADQYKEIQKEVQSLLSDHDELKTRLLNVVHEKELAEKEIYDKDCEITRLRRQLQQIDEEQSELNTKLSGDLAQQLNELRISNTDLTDKMSGRTQDNYERTASSRGAEGAEAVGAEGEAEAVEEEEHQ